jgi:thymidine kinase
LDKKDKPKYIFIDEITHFNLAEIKALEMFAEINGIKIITAGDTLQKGAMING